ncbi:hypothetical protein [Tahibacter soli]|uniref:Uncharacterized protein n=1 Tax=Tahibacter soli TaxID=2983605 RepID=A0A9X3YMH3_9GAMM|nr:hypothetical protein [Tahibacter soli]MDC8014372.1 hypothetical protein [Tahibacter soli]
MKSATLWSLLFGAGLWSGASEAVTLRSLACNGCSPLQEEQKALASVNRGYLFVYNVANKRIRKFEVVLMASDKTADPADAKARAGATRVAATDEPAAEAESTLGTVTRELWEYAVDAPVKRIFDNIVSVENRVPGVLSGQRALEVPIRNIGLTPGDLGPRPHDPRDIAWYSSGPRGAPYNDFMDRVRDQLSDPAATERISDELADAVHGIQGQTRGVSVAVGTDSIGVDISWERIAPQLELKLCDDNGSCVTLIVKKEGNYVQVTYEGVTDKHNVSLPTREQARGMDLEWRASGREGANAYANWLRTRRLGTVEYMGSSQTGCQTGYILSCVRIEGTTMLACQLHCR